MAYLIVGWWESKCSCDPKSNVNPSATGHYDNFEGYLGKSPQGPCNEEWEHHVTTTTFPHQPYRHASVPWREDRFA